VAGTGFLRQGFTVNWVHVHLAVNHLPVVGIPLVLAILVFGGLRRNEDILRLAVGLLALLALATVGVKYTGDFAVPQLDGRFVSLKGPISQHEQAGEQATTAVFLLGLAAGISWIRTRPDRPTSTPLLVLVFLLGVASTALLIRTAWFGGVINHPELHPSGF